MSYVAECFWPDLRQAVVDDAAERVRRSAAELSVLGAGVELTGTILLPADEVVFFLFDCDSAEVVRQACERAQLPFERVVESVSTSVEERAR